MHKPFDDLCTLAITGQISNSEKVLLDEHMRHCERCRDLVESLQPEFSHRHIAPVLAELLLVPADPPKGMRERFLNRANEAGLNLNAGEVLACESVVPAASSIEKIHSQQEISKFGRLPSWREFRFVPALAAFCAIILCAIAADVVVRRHGVHRQAPADGLNAEVAGSAKALTVSVVPNHDEEMKAEIARLRADVETEAAQEAKLKALNEALQHSLGSASQDLALRSAESTAQQAETQAAKAQLAEVRHQLEDTKAQVLVLDAASAAQERLTQEAQEKVSSLRAEIDRVYSARSTAETMISSRNLHIVDVFDTTNGGSQQRAFGRVFFVEGKSLVLYAYDLPSPRRGKNFSFQLWGEGAGAVPVTYKLGLMRPDTTGPGRWVVSCDDPKMLNHLRAVFIAPSTPKNDPPSQKLMYAYLGQANHP